MLNLLHAVMVNKKAESLTPEQIQELQRKRFKKLLSHVLEKSRFYKRYYQAHGITERDIDKVTAEDLPVIDKQIVMENYDELVCDPALKKAEIERFISDFPNPTINYKGIYKVIHTSGSSGTPGLFVYGPRDWAIGKSLNFRASIVRISPFRLRIAFIGATDGHYAGVSGVRDVPRLFFNILPLSISNPLEKIRRDITDFQPNALNGYASGLGLLAHEQLAGNLNLSVEKIWCIGEPLAPATRSRIEKAFGVNPIDCYGASETLLMSCECIACHRLHLFDDWFSVQLVDADSRPVSDGLAGRVIITNLYNYTQPLIRYRMDDEIVLSSEPCPCGWPFRVIEKIVGRSEQTLWFKKADGTREFIHPIVLAEFFVPGLEKFQFVQDENNRLTIRAVISGKKDDIIPAIHNRMTEILSQNALNETVKFDVKLVDNIPNDPKTGKFRLVIPYSNEI